MTRLLLVRHAEPAAAWGDHDDPGLSSVGARQAADVAARLTDPARPCPRRVVSSPLARAQATAGPLAERLRRSVEVEPRLGEIPTPPGATADRAAWLRDVMARRWPTLDDDLQAWRQGVLAALAELDDAVVATHFVAINVAVGAARGDDRVRCCSPSHVSVTELAAEAGTLTVVAMGAELATSPVR